MSKQETRVLLPTSLHTFAGTEEKSLQLTSNVTSEVSGKDELSKLCDSFLTTQEIDSKQTFLPLATGSL